MIFEKNFSILYVKENSYMSQILFTLRFLELLL